MIRIIFFGLALCLIPAVSEAGGGRQASIASMLRSLGDNASLRCSSAGSQIAAVLMPIEKGQLDRWALIWERPGVVTPVHPPLALTSSSQLPLVSLISQADAQRYSAPVQLRFASSGNLPRCMVNYEPNLEELVSTTQAIRNLSNTESLSYCLRSFGRPIPELPTEAWLSVRGPRDWVLQVGPTQLECDVRSIGREERDPESITIANRVRWDQFTVAFEERRGPIMGSLRALQAQLNELVARHRADRTQGELALQIGNLTLLIESVVAGGNRSLMEFMRAWIQENGSAVEQ
jgi:hypothetical protein